VDSGTVPDKRCRNTADKHGDNYENMDIVAIQSEEERREVD
jgi:hypothetical protein